MTILPRFCAILSDFVRFRISTWIVLVWPNYIKYRTVFRIYLCKLSTGPENCARKEMERNELAEPRYSRSPCFISRNESDIDGVVAAARFGQCMWNLFCLKCLGFSEYLFFFFFFFFKNIIT